MYMYVSGGNKVEVGKAMLNLVSYLSYNSYYTVAVNNLA